MAYDEFSLEEIQERFGLENRVVRLFDTLAPIAPGDLWQQFFSSTRRLPIRREKYRGEALVLPVLLDLYQRNAQYFTIYSGESLKVDDQLNGTCDFLLARDVGSYNLQCPLIPIVQAAENDLDLGVSPCAARMIGVNAFNEKKGVALEAIYGCVTTGEKWLFMKLEGALYIDSHIYYLKEINQLLAVFQSIIDYYKEVLK